MSETKFWTYKELGELPASAFLNWEQFKTPNDHLPQAGYSELQYRKGLELGRNAETIFISVTSVWSSNNKDGSHTQSYEGIGYHSCTAELLRGFIDSGCSIVVYRDTPHGVTQEKIQ